MNIGWLIIGGLVVLLGLIIGGTIKFLIPYIKAEKKCENNPPFWCDDDYIIYS